jgi:hypothetical protein
MDSRNCFCTGWGRQTIRFPTDDIATTRVLVESTQRIAKQLMVPAKLSDFFGDNFASHFIPFNGAAIKQEAVAPTCWNNVPPQ